MSTATFSHSAHFLSTVREMFAGWFDSRTAVRSENDSSPIAMSSTTMGRPRAISM